MSARHALGLSKGASATDRNFSDEAGLEAMETKESKMFNSLISGNKTDSFGINKHPSCLESLCRETLSVHEMDVFLIFAFILKKKRKRKNYSQG